MNELGFYDFYNDFSVSINTDLSDSDTTIFHEMTHMSVTLQSGYGNFLMLLDRGCAIDPKYSFVKQFFMGHMLKLQEAISTFAELVMIYIVKGVDKLEEYIEDLKFSNKKYYNYTYPLLYLFSFIDTKYPHGSKPCYIVPKEQLLSSIFTIAIESLNVDLTSVYSTDILLSKKILKRTENNPKFSNLFPNRRFYKAIHELARQLHLMASNKYTLESFKTIIDNVYKNAFESRTEYKDSTSRINAFLSSNKQFVKDLFLDSPDYYIIFQNIDKIEIKEVPIERLRAYAMPSSPFLHYRTADSVIFSVNDYESLSIDAFFIVGDNKALHDTIDNKHRAFNKLREEYKDSAQKIINLSFLFSILQLPEPLVFMHAYKYDEKKVYIACVDKTELQQLNSDTPIIVNYKYFNGFQQLHLTDKRIYYYCDRAYENAIGLFNSIHKINTMPYTFIQYDGSLSVFVIKLNSNEFYFIPIVTPLIYLILEDMENGKLFINKEKRLMLNNQELHDLGAIINCLYCTNSTTSK